jgi:hypothetical protein
VIAGVTREAAAAVLRLAGVGPLATMVFYSVSTWAVVV